STSQPPLRVKNPQAKRDSCLPLTELVTKGFFRGQRVGSAVNRVWRQVKTAVDLQRRCAQQSTLPLPSRDTDAQCDRLKDANEDGLWCADAERQFKAAPRW